MKYAHCGSLCGHTVYLGESMQKFCSVECQEKYNKSQSELPV